MATQTETIETSPFPSSVRSAMIHRFLANSRCTLRDPGGNFVVAWVESTKNLIFGGQGKFEGPGWYIVYQETSGGRCWTSVHKYLSGNSHLTPLEAQSMMLPYWEIRVDNKTTHEFTMDPGSVQNKLAEDQVDFLLQFWSDVIPGLYVAGGPTFGRRFVVGGRMYTPHEDHGMPASCRGFGGSRFKFETHDGVQFESTNVWSQGDIPQELIEFFPDNARIAK